MPKNCSKVLLSCLICFLGTNICSAQTLPSAFSPITTLDLDKAPPIKSEVTINLERTQNNYKSINLDKNNDYYDLTDATDRFVQCNIRAAWDNFKSLINSVPDNDFLYIAYANKMSELGFFDLANYANLKTKDKDISNVSIDAMKRFYFPRKKLRLEDELSLAEAYSNIEYNNQSSEAVNDLLKKDLLLSSSDYANYLVALGYYKSSSFIQAAKYINIAVLQNPSNLNYQRLKAEILAENKEPEEAVKIVETLKKQNLNAYEYERKIQSLEQFILYKTKKAQWEKDYHLGYYYYLENDPSKAIRTLQTALSAKKGSNAGLIYGLMSEIYLSMNEFEKASDTAKKSHKSNCHNSKALITLGDLSSADKNYKQALDYYKKAAAQDKKSYIPLVKEAQAYQNLSNTKKAKEIYTKILKTHSDCWEAYYNTALLEPEKQSIYIKKALAINPLFEKGWIELAKKEINTGNYEIAQKYLSNAFYIDENDFRYYYYQGLIDNAIGDYSQAKFNFKKCLKLKENFKDAQDALNAILNAENNSARQDSI